MADIFVSYSREDRARADQIANALQDMGLDVFWDSEIPPGQTWADYIETKLNECKAVVVLWSEHSTKSQWVREEARMGRDKGKLIPAMIDGAQSPFGFGEVQAANLASWTGEPNHSEWRRFSEAVRAAAQRERPAAAPAAAPVSPQPYQPSVSVPPAAPAMRPAYAPPPGAAPSSGGGFSFASIKPIWWIGGLAALALIIVIGIVAAAGGGGQNLAQTPPVAPGVAPPAVSGGPAPLPPSAGGDAANYQAQILARLGEVQGRMAQEGYQMIGQASPGALQQGQTSSLPATLNVGVQYQIVGVCDQDCSDLDLTLVDQNNNVISQDTSSDNQPTVSVAPTWTGPFTVHVQMYQCTVQPCYFAVALFGRQAQ
jgi:hypothetical protein